MYLASRYEIQVLDSFGLEAKNNECGAIYGVAAPRTNACYPPGQWEGPYEIAWRALEVLGDAKGAELMHSEYEAALAARTGPPKLKECA